MAAVQVCSAAGEKTWIDVSDNILTVKQLKEKAVKELPWTPGQTADNVRLTLNGETLEESTPLSKCSYLPLHVFHLVLRVHGG